MSPDHYVKAAVLALLVWRLLAARGPAEVLRHGLLLIGAGVVLD